MQLKILTPERVVLEEDQVDAVYAESTSGSFGVLPKHLPLVAPLAISVLSYRKNKAPEKHYVSLIGGMLNTDGDRVTVLSHTAELGSEIDAARAKLALERAQARIKENQMDVDAKRAELALSRAMARVKATSLS